MYGEERDGETKDRIEWRRKVKVVRVGIVSKKIFCEERFLDLKKGILTLFLSFSLLLIYWHNFSFSWTRSGMPFVSPPILPLLSLQHITGYLSLHSPRLTITQLFPFSPFISFISFSDPIKVFDQKYNIFLSHPSIK